MGYTGPCPNMNEESTKRERDSRTRYQRDAQAGAIHRTVKLIGEREAGIGVAALAEGIRRHPRQLMAQFRYMCSHMQMRAGIGRPRPMSYGTVKTYLSRMSAFLAHLKRLNIHPVSLSDLTSRQVLRVFQKLFRENAKPAYVASINSVLRRFGVWINKPALCPPLKYMTDEEGARKRSSALTEPKDLGIDAVAREMWIEERVASVCEHADCLLRLCSYFGLRAEESLSAVPAEMIHGDILHVIRGTKGGLSRIVPIETDEQRKVLDKALALAAQHPLGLICDKKYKTLSQAQNRFRYVMRKAGITKRDAGFTPHSLRHSYARDVYVDQTGTDTPVRGGAPIQELDDKARGNLSRRLGHRRKNIVDAYIGSSSDRSLSPARKSNIQDLIGRLESDDMLCRLVRDVGASAVFVVGPHAEGLKTEPRDTVLIRLAHSEFLDQQIVNELTARCKQLLGCSLVLALPSSTGGGLPELELTGLVGS